MVQKPLNIALTMGEQVYRCKSCGHVLTKKLKNNESLKQEINELLSSGKVRDMDDIAKHYGVSKRTVQRWISKWNNE